MIVAIAGACSNPDPSGELPRRPNSGGGPAIRVRPIGSDFCFSPASICKTHRLAVSCPGCVPHPITAFLDSSDCESAIRNAMSLDGDADTMAASLGGNAEACCETAPSFATNDLLEQVRLMCVAGSGAAKVSSLMAEAAIGSSSVRRPPSPTPSGLPERRYTQHGCALGTPIVFSGMSSVSSAIDS